MHAIVIYKHTRHMTQMSDILTYFTVRLPLSVKFRKVSLSLHRRLALVSETVVVVRRRLLSVGPPRLQNVAILLESASAFFSRGRNVIVVGVFSDA